MPTLFDVKIGESQSAIEEESGEDERVQVRGSGGRFFVQENTVAEDGRQLNKQTIGRGSRDVDRQIDRARSRVSERIDGIDPVTFERQIPTGMFAPDGTQPDASVPSDRGPEGRFVSGQRKPVDSFGREEIGGQFTPFDIGASLGGLGSTDEQFGDSPTTVSVERSFSSAEEERGGDLFETAHAEGIGGSGTEDSALGLADAAPDTLGAGFERTDVIREEGARQIETARFRRNDPAAPFDEVIDVQEINGDFTIMDGIAEGGEVDTGPQFRTGGSIESQDDAFSMASQLAEPRDSGGEWR